MKLNRLLCWPLALLLLLTSSCAPPRKEVIPAYDSEYQVVIELYWTTWCNWCKKEMAELDQANEYLNERGVDVVAVQTDVADHDRVYGFTIVHGQLPRGISGVPYHRILVSGELYYESVGYEAPNKLIERALAYVE